MHSQRTKVQNQNTSFLYPFSLDTSGTFGFAPVCPTGYCKPGITEANMTEQDSLTEQEYYVEDVRMDIL